MADRAFPDATNRDTAGLNLVQRRLVRSLSQQQDDSALPRLMTDISRGTSPSLVMPSPLSATAKSACPSHLKGLSLIDFLSVSCRPGVILMLPSRSNVRSPIDASLCEYENPAFTGFYTSSERKRLFIAKAIEVISCFPDGQRSFCTRILSHQCTCTLITSTLVLVSWNNVPVPPRRPSNLLPEDRAVLSMGAEDQARILETAAVVRRQPIPKTIDRAEPWEIGAEALGWSRYKDFKLTPHQKRIAGYPWHETPLGHISTWSVAHRLATSALGMNPNPRCLYWGPNVIAIYNEPAAPMFGNKHPSFFGKDPAEIWPETWPQTRPKVFKAMNEGKPSRNHELQLFLQRRGFMEEAFFDSVYLPLPGVDSEDNGVLQQFSEVTDAVIARRQESLVVAINDGVQNASNMSEFWQVTMRELQNGPSDVVYALLFTPVDGSSPLNTPALHQTRSTEYRLTDSIGFESAPYGSDFSYLSNGSSEREHPLANAMHECHRKDRVIILDADTGSLPEKLNVAIPGRGFDDVVTRAAIFPVSSLHGQPIGFMVLGLSPRRPLDERTLTFTQVIRDCLIKGAAISALPLSARRNQKQMDELHQALLARLHESKLESHRLSERFQRVSDSAPIGMFISSPDGVKKLYVNDAYLELAGVKREDVNNPDAWVGLICDEDKDRVFAATRQIVNKHQPFMVEFKTNMLYKVIDEVTGHPILVPQYLRTTCIPEFDDEGTMTCIQGWVTNISQERFSQTLLNSRLDEVMASKQNAENFIDMVSHEMRNPLSAILQSADGIVAMMEEHGETDGRSSIDVSAETVESVLDASQTIILCAQHQKRIVDDILTLSKLDANLLVISPDKTNPAKLLPKALKMFEAQLVRNAIEASVNIESSVNELGIEDVMLDSSRVLQIVINLLTNAIKFTSHAQTRQISLILSASMTCPADESHTSGVDYIPRRGNRQRNSIAEMGAGQEVFLTFMVRDTGKGLTPEEKASLFQRFSQASPKTYKKYGGSGLGLFISRELTELQNGQIGVRSTAGQGSTFAFYITARRWMPVTPLEGGMLIESIHTPTMLESPVAYSRRETAAMFDSSARKSSLGGGTLTPPPSSPMKSNMPRLPPPPTSHSPNSTDCIKPKTTEKQPPMSVLIVEDNVINQKVMAKQIRAAGHTVHVANHGLEALDFLRRSTFCSHLSPATQEPDYLNQGSATGLLTSAPIELSVILMDLEMPILDGLSCVKQVRDLQASGDIRGHVPVIAVTANARSEQIALALAAGMDEVVTKPFRIWQVLERAAGLVKVKLRRGMGARPALLHGRTGEGFRKDKVEEEMDVRMDSFMP